MVAISWLHLSDLHEGQSHQRRLFPNLRDELLQDLRWLCEGAGQSSWRGLDAVLFTGDLTQSGSKKDFLALSELLNRLWGEFEKLGCQPILLAVPGNHDLQWPKKESAALRSMAAMWFEDAALRAEFWKSPSNEYRKLIRQLFLPYSDWYQDWQKAHPAPGRQRDWNDGLLPGDFATTIQKGDLRVGMVGLNSAFLQLKKGDYLGRLALDSRQLAAACKKDVSDWVAEQHVTMLLTHHPVDWLSAESQQHFDSEISPAGRFHYHLFGHMHLANDLKIHHGGNTPVHRLQGASLFGLEEWGESQKRIHGYSFYRLELNEGSHGTLQRWPRSAYEIMGGGHHIRVDYRYGGVPRDQMFIREAFTAHRPLTSSVTPNPAIPAPSAVAVPAALRDGEYLQVGQPGAARQQPRPPGTSYEAAWHVQRLEAESVADSYLAAEGSPVVLWAPNKFGKSWLLQHLCERARRDTLSPARTIMLDLRLCDDNGVGTSEAFLHDMAEHIAREFKDPEAQEDFSVNWRSGSSPVLQITNLMERLLLRGDCKRLLLCIDEADAVWGRPYKRVFFSMLRNWAERSHQAGWARLRLLLAVATAPGMLHDNPVTSPFNLTPPIQLGDFEKEQIEQLARWHGLPWGSAEISALHAMIGGHPYLVRLAMFDATRSVDCRRILHDEQYSIDLFSSFIKPQLQLLQDHPELLDALCLIMREPRSRLHPSVEDRLTMAGLLIHSSENGFGLRYPIYEPYISKLRS